MHLCENNRFMIDGEICNLHFNAFSNQQMRIAYPKPLFFFLLVLAILNHTFHSCPPCLHVPLNKHAKMTTKLKLLSHLAKIKQHTPLPPLHPPTTAGSASFSFIAPLAANLTDVKELQAQALPCHLQEESRVSQTAQLVVVGRWQTAGSWSAVNHKRPLYVRAGQCQVSIVLL